MEFKWEYCSHCYQSEERYYQQSTNPYCSYCGNFLTGQKKLTANEYYKQMGIETKGETK